MSVRHVKRTMTLCAAVLVGAAAILAGLFVSPANASTLTSSDGFTALSTQGTVAAQTPYSSGQLISIDVATNPTMNSTSLINAGFPGGADPIKFLECADPGGTTTNLPTKPTECEPGTIQTIAGAAADGSMHLDGSNGYTILDLPDPNLGSSNGNTCDIAPNQCVIGIFSNQNDFSKPHLFSAPFVVSSNGGADNGAHPGDGTSPTGVAPAITSANHVTFIQGTAGTFTVTATGTPVPTFSETGPLPGGVTLTSAGLLSGTPTVSGNFPITITAGNGVSPNATQAFALTVDAAPAITSSNHTAFVQGTAGTFMVTATGFPAPTFSETGSLPGGVTLSTAGVLSGTPTASGSFPITITASNGVTPNATQAFTLTVTSSGVAPTITSANHTTFTQGTAGTFTVTATGSPAPTFSETGSLPGGVTLSTAGLLSGTPTASGSFPITITASNGVTPNTTQAFTLTVNNSGVAPTITSANHATFTQGTAGTFTVTATGSPTPTFSETGSLPGGVTLTSAGVLSGTPAATGTFPITITASNGVTPNATQSFTLTVLGFHISTTSLPNAVAGTPYSQQLQAQGQGSFTVIWKKVSLPKGFRVSSSGVLSGTPSAKVLGPTGGVDVSATAGKNGQMVMATIPLTIDGAPTFGKKPVTAAGLTEGTFGSVTLTSTGYPAPTIALAGGSLPSGVTFTGGVLSGNPGLTTNSSVISLTFAASNGISPPASEAFALTVYAPLVVTSPTSLPSATHGQAYGPINFTALGGAVGGTGYVWKKVSLPKGLVLSSTGSLSGTPKSPGNDTVVVKVESKDGKAKVSGQVSLSLAVS